jgi:hypothetical protein
MNAEYAACLNQVEPDMNKTMRIAPYVWDPCILTDDGRRHVTWKPRQQGEKPCIIIMEPNISFQKSAILPILIVEAYARAHPEQDFDLVLLNGDRLIASGYFKANIEPYLTIATQGKLKYASRHDMVSIMKSYPSGTAICHHVNNEFNYMVLEFLHAGYPVLHNSVAWKDFGYYYPENDTQQGSSVLHEALHNHQQRFEAYKGHGKALAWRHSIYNPTMQEAWKTMLDDVIRLRT